MILEDSNPIRLKVLHRISNYLLEGFSTLGIICFFLAFYEYVQEFMPDFILPPTLDILHRALNLLLQSQENILITLYRITVAVSFAFICGSICGLIAGYFKTLRAFLKPFIDILMGIAPIVWIILALIWFGIGNMSVIFTVFITVLPLSFANALMGVLTLDASLKEVCIVYRFSLVKKLYYYYMPHILPYLLSSLSVVVAMGIKITIMAELLGANSGVGAEIADARVYLDTTTVLAYVVLLLSLIFLFEFLVIKPLRIIFLSWLDK